MQTTPTAHLHQDYRIAAEGCGLLDRSERGKLAVSGSEAASALQGEVTNDVESLAVGAGLYAAFLTPKGKMLGDVRISRFADEFFLDCERIALQPLFNLLRHGVLGRDAQLHKRTLECGLLSLVGPKAGEIIGVSLGDDEYDCVREQVAGKDISLLRTDIGIDLVCESNDLEAVRCALIQRGAVEISEQTVEIIRVERGRPRYDLDLDDTVIPQEAGLNERAVSFTKGCYVGQETVARLFYRGKPNRHLRRLLLDRPAERGMEVKLGDRVVGKLGTVVDSPNLGITALAILRREVAIGSTVEIPAAGAIAKVEEATVFLQN